MRLGKLRNEVNKGGATTAGGPWFLRVYCAYAAPTRSGTQIWKVVKVGPANTVMVYELLIGRILKKVPFSHIPDCHVSILSGSSGNTANAYMQCLCSAKKRPKSDSSEYTLWKVMQVAVECTNDGPQKSIETDFKEEGRWFG